MAGKMAIEGRSLVEAKHVGKVVMFCSLTVCRIAISLPYLYSEAMHGGNYGLCGGMREGAGGEQGP